jgi:hypothetical protein
MTLTQIFTFNSPGLQIVGKLFQTKINQNDDKEHRHHGCCHSHCLKGLEEKPPMQLEGSGYIPPIFKLKRSGLSSQVVFL